MFTTKRLIKISFILAIGIVIGCAFGICVFKYFGNFHNIIAVEQCKFAPYFEEAANIDNNAFAERYAPLLGIVIGVLIAGIAAIAGLFTIYENDKAIERADIIKKEFDEKTKKFDKEYEQMQIACNDKINLGLADINKQQFRNELLGELFTEMTETISKAILRGELNKDFVTDYNSNMPYVKEYLITLASVLSFSQITNFDERKAVYKFVKRFNMPLLRRIRETIWKKYISMPDRFKEFLSDVEYIDSLINEQNKGVGSNTI